jgi:4-hydroxybenzoate polyprenyltransferase
MRYPGMERKDDPEKSRRPRVTIRRPFRLAIFSAAILTLAAIAMSLIIDGATGATMASASIH